MSEIIIRGGVPLSGEVRIQGAKNSVLPILAATLLAEGPVRLRRCPRLRDVDRSVQILRALGCTARWDGGDLLVDPRGLSGQAVPAALARQTRSSVIFLGAILARCGSALCPLPGGDELGPRPIDLHLAGLRAMGAEIREGDGVLSCRAAHLRGTRIHLPIPSVGATEHLMLTACAAEGETVISGAAREPEIVDLQEALRACGARVRGAGTDVVSVQGGRPLHGCTCGVMPDRIVAATYLCAAVSAGGSVFLRGAREEDLGAVAAVLRRSGCRIVPDAEGIRCSSIGRPCAPPPVRTAPWPGFATDAQAPLTAALLRARGTVTVREDLFEDRFRHVTGLRRMGADIRVEGRTAVVRGVAALRGAEVTSTDVRGGAALCVAALAAEGASRIGATEHIDRGHEDLVRDLRALGADIERTGDLALSA